MASARFLVVLLASASFALLLHPPPSSASTSQGRLSFDVSELVHPITTTCFLPKGMGPSKLEVVHRYGPCSPFEDRRRQPPPHAKILRDDQARVNSLRRRMSAAIAGKPRHLNGRSMAAVALPAQAGGNLGTGDYIVTIGFGTPRRDLIVGFDTGSDLTWVQCTPCVGCYKQVNQFFDPRQSSTYGTYSCGSNVCQKLQNRRCFSWGSVCRYNVTYGDDSHTVGKLGHDTLTLRSDAVPGFTFGCGDNNNGTFGSTAGLIGLGRERFSLPSQLSPNYGSVFSYCLPANLRAKGYLAIGRDATPSSSGTQYTSMITSDSGTYYLVRLTAIEVDGKALPIQPTVLSATPAVMDSGTVITRLPSAAYVALREAFKNGMTMYKPAPAFETLDTCYDFTGMSMVGVPNVTIVFDGPARLQLDFTGIIYVVNVSRCCLAFVAKDADEDPTIIGNVQQRRYGVIYDMENSKIGFTPRTC